MQARFSSLTLKHLQNANIIINNNLSGKLYKLSKDNIDKEKRLMLLVQRIVWSLTIFWFVFWVIYLAANFPTPDKSSHNNWGDFFAGIFAPLAFLWLVIGYFQQRIELRQNTEVLKLQNKELKNSVEQQKQLAEIAKKEFQLIQEQYSEQKKNLKQQQLDYEKSLRPRLVYETCTVNSEEDDIVVIGLLFENLGSPIGNVTISLSENLTKDSEAINIPIQQTPFWAKNKKDYIEVEVVRSNFEKQPKRFYFVIELEYDSMSSKLRNQMVNMSFSANQRGIEFFQELDSGFSEEKSKT